MRLLVHLNVFLGKTLLVSNVLLALQLCILCFVLYWQLTLYEEDRKVSVIECRLPNSVHCVFDELLCAGVDDTVVTEHQQAR